MKQIINSKLACEYFSRNEQQTRIMKIKIINDIDKVSQVNKNLQILCLVSIKATK